MARQKKTCDPFRWLDSPPAAIALVVTMYAAICRRSGMRITSGAESKSRNGFFIRRSWTLWLPAFGLGFDFGFGERGQGGVADFAEIGTSSGFRANGTVAGRSHGIV